MLMTPPAVTPSAARRRTHTGLLHDAVFCSLWEYRGACKASRHGVTLLVVDTFAKSQDRPVSVTFCLATGCRATGRTWRLFSLSSCGITKALGNGL